jgi:glycosyltransferase involved in cell wall biosynthesis
VGIRLVVVDDNPHIAWEGRVYPVNATFQHFVSGLLDLPGGPVASITSCVPLRAGPKPPATRPLDPRIRVVGTAPFDGIGGYLRHLPALLRANRTILGRAIAEADLVWIKIPASNAGLAAAIAGRAGVPRFIWVAGSAADVARARYGGARAVGAGVVGLGYDLIGRVTGVGGHRLVVGDGIVGGDGIVASLVEPAELRDPALRPWLPDPGHARLVWAGRLAEGKGLEALLAAVAVDPGLTLDLLGEGPARDGLRAIADASGASERVTWAGHLADRAAYMDRLAGADAFVFPSPAEGFPKVILDALVLGLPVVATRAGALSELVEARLVEPIARPDPHAISAAWRGLRDADPGEIADRRRRGHAFAAGHSRPAEAARLVDRWRAWWPTLPWSR